MKMQSGYTEMTPSRKIIEEFASLVQAGIDAWECAGLLLVNGMKTDPDLRNKIVRSCPHLSEAILSRFEAIGNRMLHPKTLLNNSPGMVRLRELPYEQQERYLTEPIEVLVPRMDGKTCVERVLVSSLSPSQARQCISRNGVRSVEQQAARQKQKVALRDGREAESISLREAYEKLGASNQDDEDEDVEPVESSDCDALMRFRQFLENAEDALANAAEQLNLLKRDPHLDGYVPGCLKGISILRMAMKEGRIKA